MIRTLATGILSLLLLGGTTAANASTSTRTSANGTVTIEWSKYICPDPDLDIDSEPDEKWAPADLPVGAAPEIAFDGEDIEPDAEPAAPDVEEDEPVFTVQPWRARYFSDGSFELWHDERCVPDDASMGYAYPSESDLAQAARANARTQAHAARSTHRRSQHR